MGVFFEHNSSCCIQGERFLQILIKDRDAGEESADIAFIEAAKEPYSEFGRIYD